MKLTSKNVTETVKHCLYEPHELSVPGVAPDDAVVVDGIMRKFGFHPGRLKEKADEIHSMLQQLPETFMASKGGGWSFLNACNTNDGELWGQHQDMEGLFALGIATGKATYLMPREMWSMLPGGMPYVQVRDT